MQDVADLLGRRAVLLLQSHDEVERSLALHDLRRRRAADRRLDQAVHARRTLRPYRASFARSTVIVRLGCPSSCTSVTCLMPGHLLDDRLDLRVPSSSSTSRSVPKIFTSSDALEPGQRFVDRVLGRLRVVEGDARETPTASSASRRSARPSSGTRRSIRRTA